ncbi:NAD-binding protein [Cupriavidus sp. CV2]|uniref:NAD-binding protein n=1 Tax=Cupriavidus ulmosensis TaxID=3065913 RepID=UPI00296ABDF7|nr:NAD-binding protein [Cupriavidus sp. CV2]MDW3682802.1 NAD-binding protein [Cupriavidus sp. CV2]
MKVGYVGLGALGGELARRFLGKHELFVWDLNPQALETFRSLGATVATSAADLGKQCDAVVVCLPRSADVLQLVSGPAGLAAGLSAGKIVIDQTSGIPAETRKIASLLSEIGVQMMDAAVSASPQIVASGGATLMVAGPDDVYDRALPLLETMAGTIYRCGNRIGDGQAMKMVNNAMNGACRMGMLEIVAMGIKAGISLERMAVEVNESRLGRSQVTEKMLPALVEGRASTRFGLPLMLKDITQAMMLGMEVGVPLPVTSVVRGLLQVGVNTLGHGSQLEDMVGVIGNMAATSIGPSGAENKPASEAAGLDARAVSALVEAAMFALGQLVTYECTALGVAYGLSVNDISTVINSSSGWSGASRALLPALVAGDRIPVRSLHEVADKLSQACALGSRVGAPMFVANQVRCLYEQAVVDASENADVAEVAGVIEVASGVRFAQ